MRLNTANVEKGRNGEKWVGKMGKTLLCNFVQSPALHSHLETRFPSRLWHFNISGMVSSGPFEGNEAPKCSEEHSSQEDSMKVRVSLDPRKFRGLMRAMGDENNHLASFADIRSTRSESDGSKEVDIEISDLYPSKRGIGLTVSRRDLDLLFDATSMFPRIDLPKNI